jgi:hypothetical protein
MSDIEERDERALAGHTEKSRAGLPPRPFTTLIGRSRGIVRGSAGRPAAATIP